MSKEINKEMSKEKANSLLNCPFCDGEAKLFSNGGGIDICYHWIYCKECGCKQPPSIHKEAVINAWNTRKPVDDVVEALEKELDIKEEEMEMIRFIHMEKL